MVKRGTKQGVMGGYEQKFEERGEVVDMMSISHLSEPLSLK